MDFESLQMFKKLFGKLFEEHIKNPRIAVYDNGNHFKYNENNEVEWAFSLRYGW
jgi:hypothetical protein